MLIVLPAVEGRDIRNRRFACTKHTSQISSSLYYHRRRLLAVKSLEEVFDGTNVSLEARLG